MRLIDADAEIVKIKQEIQRIESRIKEWEDNREDRCRYYVVDARIQQFHMNISDYRSEIKALESYRTAYDADKVVERIDNEVPGITNLQILKIDEIVKAGGVNESIAIESEG